MIRSTCVYVFLLFVLFFVLVFVSLRCRHAVKEKRHEANMRRIDHEMDTRGRYWVDAAREKAMDDAIEVTYSDEFFVFVFLFLFF